MKRVKNTIYDALNPKTYEKNNIKKIRFYYEMYNVYFVLTLTMVTYYGKLITSSSFQLAYFYQQHYHGFKGLKDNFICINMIK